MKRYLLFILLVFSVQLCFGQTLFSKQIYFNDHASTGNDILSLDSTYLIVGAEAEDSYYNDLYVLEIDTIGNIKTQKSIDIFPNSGTIHHVFENDETSFYIQGTLSLDIYTTFFNNQYFLAKIDRTTLDTIWMQDYGLDTMHESTGDAIRTQDGGFAITGWAFNEDIGTQYTTLMKLDSIGELEFYNHYTSDTTTINFGVSLTETQDSGYMILGFQRYSTIYENFPRTVTDMYLLKINSLGQEEWMEFYDADLDAGYRTNQPRDIMALEDGGYYISGNRIFFEAPSGQRYIMYKVDSDGQVVWENEYGWNEWTAFSNMLLSSNGNLILSGYEDDFNNISDNRMYGVLASMSTEGDSLWLRKYAMSPDVFNIDWLKDILETPDGGYIATGDTGGPTLEDTTFQYVQNVWVIRVDSLGCLEPNCDLPPDSTVAVEDLLEEEISAVIKLYPNPVQDQLNIDIGEELVLLGVQVYDSNGRRVEDIQFFRSHGLHRYEIGVGHLVSGMYMVQIRTDEGWVTGKVVKM